MALFNPKIVSSVLQTVGELQTQTARDAAADWAKRAGDPALDLQNESQLEQEFNRVIVQGVLGYVAPIRTAKGGSVFCYPENIVQEMEKQFAKLSGAAFLPGAEIEAFVAATADFLSELNAIHPFREGNGRTQLYFVRLLGLRAGHPFRSEAVEPDAFLRAMIESYYGKTDALVDELERMLA